MLRDFRHRHIRQIRFLDLQLGQIGAVGHAQPAVVGPRHLLNGGLTTERATQFRHKRTAGQVHQIRFAVRQIHVRSVTGLLQYGFRIEVTRLQMVVIGTFVGFLRLGGDERTLRIRLVRTPHIAGTAHGHGMVVAGAAFGAHDVVPAITLGQMRRFDAATVCCASPDTLRIADHVLGFRIVFHAADHAGLLIAFTGFPSKADDVLSAIIVMQDGCVESG